MSKTHELIRKPQTDNSSLDVVIHWVACSERMPERRKRVLVTDGELVTEAHLNKRSGAWEGYTIVGIKQLEQPIWWAELPEPPCV